MLKRPVTPLPPREKFDGAGVYAIYYVGAFEAYKPIAEKNHGADTARPIYVGKAVPPGARKGGFGLRADPGKALLKRLREHAKSIQEVKNLDIEDFSCKYLVCEDIWIPLGESLLIERFQPPWNVLIEGFGIHTPGKGRKKQVRSKWDTLHPGRSLAKGLPANPMSKDKIVNLVSDFFAGKKVPVLLPDEAVIKEEEQEEE
ncbi:MAG TPA: Eco29kI family restriction endonuclease [Candidatus Acidoferrales bacterium]|nr:Eco29kI family restriction endonuclease [Candidatus Acidoferrales bacterium]